MIAIASLLAVLGYLHQVHETFPGDCNAATAHLRPGCQGSPDRPLQGQLVHQERIKALERCEEAGECFPGASLRFQLGGSWVTLP